MIADNLDDEAPNARPITYIPALIRRLCNVPEGHCVVLVGDSDGVLDTARKLTEQGLTVDVFSPTTENTSPSLPAAIVILECPADDIVDLGPKLKVLIDRWLPELANGGMLMGTGYHPYYVGVPSMLWVEFEKKGINIAAATPGIWMVVP